MDKKTNKTTVSIISVTLAVVLIAAGIYLEIEYEYIQKVISLIDEGMSPALFVALMIVLPVAGFPITVFLIIGGIKFGIFYMILLWLLILPIHPLIAYYLASPLEKPLRRFSKKMGYPIPKLPEDRTAMYSFLFLAIPAIPYAVKNYLLPLAGAPFTYCVIMNFLVQFPQGIPFIILGKSATDLNLTLFYIALALIIAIYFVLRWLKKKYGHKIGVS